jgi:phosphatidylglycerol lysyltransferase
VGEATWARGNERLIHLVYEYGNALYNYRGLRRYKEKFNPVWRNLYLAYPHERQVRPLLIDLAVLVAGGYKRVLKAP